jgi:hypothetical protein
MKFSYYTLIFALAFFVSCGKDDTCKKKEAQDPVYSREKSAELKNYEIFILSVNFRFSIFC